ncbi:hypothetical protein CPB85DRAFT_1373676 [Mucidula mucida]|nr:hypothetical protein CPB85DRAFT_1373676 [Mucidula mucida]
MFASCFALLALAAVHAVPLVPRDVYNPPIITPNADTVWGAGSIQTVTWDTTNLPPDSQLTNPNGKIVLGFLANNSENLMLANPLAQDFKLSDGQVEITVPSVEFRDDYIIVLFGDSGNVSPEFTIDGLAIASQSGQSSGSSSSTSLITTPIPITGTVITGGSSVASSTDSESIPTSSSTRTLSSVTPSSSSTVSDSATAEAASQTDNGGLGTRAPSALLPSICLLLGFWLTFEL